MRCCDDVLTDVLQVLDTLKDVCEVDEMSPKSESQTEICSSSSALDAKSKAKERQAALLASFAAQQKEFADVMLTEGDSGDDDDDDDWREKRNQKVECVICSVSSEPSAQNPMGVSSYPRIV